jgi:hypothetical protein
LVADSLLSASCACSELRGITHLDLGMSLWLLGFLFSAQHVLWCLVWEAVSVLISFYLVICVLVL